MNITLNRAIKIKQKSTSDAALNDLIIDALRDVKCKNIILMDLRHLHDAPADYFVICDGTSTTQVSAAADSIYRKVKDNLDMVPNHVEGRQSSQWVLVDFFNVVVHVFYHETRQFYELEDLWSDAKVTEYENL